MKRTEFLEMVKEEIEHIRANATKKELDNLCFSLFCHMSPFGCIYGQMTGHCGSKRAKELMPKSFLQHFFLGRDSDLSELEIVPPGIANMTALELYLYVVDGLVHERIIAYLKGEVNQLEIN